MNKVYPLTKVFDLEYDDYKTTYYNKLFHYTNTDVNDIINRSQQFKVSNITKYKEKYKEKIQYNREQEHLVFALSFSHKQYSNKEIKKFKNSNALITVDFTNDMYSLFDYSKPIIADNGDKLMWCNKEYSNYYLDNNLKHNIAVDVKCIDPKYCTNEELNNCKNEKTHVINYRPKLRIKEKWQSETRYEFTIRTTNTDSIKKYNYLLIPIKTDKMKFCEIKIDSLNE